MAAYAAVISLKKRIEGVLDSSRISLVYPSREIILITCRELKSMIKFLGKLDSTMEAKRFTRNASDRRIKSREKVNAFDARIVEAVWEFEDLLESHLSHQILSQLESWGSERDVLMFFIDLQCLRGDVESFVGTVKEYINELDNLAEEDESNYGIPPSKLITMLTAEGFINEGSKSKTPREIAFGCTMELASRSDFLKFEKRSESYYSSKTYPIKTCCLRRSWHHLCKEQAGKNKFFHVLNSRVDGIKGERRLCLHNNVLFGFKNLYNLVKHDCASTTRSLLCLGPYHQYSMPLDVGFKLLRVLDALKVRFYNFPIEILKLVLLQYLALTCNGKLPTSISKLFNLQSLIIRPHMSIPSHMPVQIWDMQELKHIMILGSSLPNPNSAASLQKLSTLVGVNADNCTKEVLEKIPNIRKLGIQIELTPQDDNSNSLSCFDHISQLENLEILKCSVVNLDVKYGFVVSPTPLSMLPSTLRKLHLSGLGYSWKYMKVIGSLPNLEVLKLRCYAFGGPKWGIKKRIFLSLRFLLIEDTDLEQWKPPLGSFPELNTLRIKHCYKLQELRWPPDTKYGSIELVDCNPLAVNCAKQLKTRKIYYNSRSKTFESYTLQVTVRSSFDDGDSQRG